MDEFPEAFERFEKRVYVDRMKTFDQLTLAFMRWAGKHWRGTSKQIEALKVEARRIGISVPPARPYKPRVRAPRTWRRETDKLGRIHFRDVLTGRFIRRPD